MENPQRSESPRPERKIATHEQTLKAIVHPDHIAVNNLIYEMLDRQQITLDQAKRMHEELLIKASSIDHMTGLDNARSAHFKLGEMMGYCQSQKIPLVGIYLDADGLKELNNLGHHFGDIAITTLALSIEHGTRRSDLPVRLYSEEEAQTTARLGGDEFFVALPGATLEEAQIVFDRIQRAYGDLTTQQLSEGVLQSLGRRLAVTGGAVQYDPNTDQIAEEFIRRADHAMQFGKENQKGILNISAVPINNPPQSPT